MFDWFDEPIVYYRRFVPMRSGVFDYMSRWMDSVDRAMEEEFGDFYDQFFARPTQQTIEDKSKDSKEEKKDETKKEEEKPKQEEETKKEEEKPKEEKKEEQKQEEENDEPQYYTFSSSMYTGSDGVQHIFREEHDSKTGNHKVLETRRIGNRSMTLHRVTDKDGNVVQEHETRKNIKNDEELEAFKRDWIARNVPQSQRLEGPSKEAPKAVKHEK